jgi:hypothetical protein
MGTSQPEHAHDAIKAVPYKRLPFELGSCWQITGKLRSFPPSATLVAKCALQNRILSLGSPHAQIDAVAILPSFVDIILTATGTITSIDQTRILRLVRLLRILRVLRMFSQ